MMTEVRRYTIMGSMGVAVRQGLNTPVLVSGTELILASDFDALAARAQAVERDNRTYIDERHELLTKNEALVQQLAASQARVRELGVAKDGAYLERNHLVAALARCFPSGIRKTAIEGWSDDWHGCVYIDLPAGQISYHYHDSQAFLFESLPAYGKPYDGHTKDDVHDRLKSAQLQATLAERERTIKELEHESMQEGEQFRQFAWEIVPDGIPLPTEGPISFGKLKEVVEAAIAVPTRKLTQAEQRVARLREALSYCQAYFDRRLDPLNNHPINIIQRALRETGAGKEDATMTVDRVGCATAEQIEQYIRMADAELGPECVDAWVEDIRQFLRTRYNTR